MWETKSMECGSMQEKYGFIYLWFDRKRKMYYIGCHWGYINDGYICSSDRMRDAYSRRPQDFRRKIISIINDRSILFEKEHEWLQLIQDFELGTKYYNLRNTKWNHWSSDIDSRLTVNQKISRNTKEAMQTPEVREKYLIGLTDRDNKSSDPGVVEKRRQSMIATMSEKFPIEGRADYNRSEQGSDIHKQKLSDASKQMWSDRTEEQKTEISKKISKKNKGLRNRAGHINTDEHRRKISESQKGKIVSQETRDKISTAVKGRKMTDEQRAAQSVRIKLSWAKRKGLAT